ncbi:MAG: cysteine hydrolase [Treponema sp.]|jgi:nicotinamidase-related amidase|nr:cysteine hydrolase [Treponema sp.]
MAENIVNLTLTLRQQELIRKNGYSFWEIREKTAVWPARETAFILVDMWDRHWCAGATARCGVLAVKINRAAREARKKGVLIVHAPSDTMDFYRSQSARERFLSGPAAGPGPEQAPVEDYPLPIDDSDGGSDTPALDSYAPNTKVWTRQTETIEIDQDLDLVCGDEGKRLFPLLRARGIRRLIYMGVHTNMCVLNRSFGIKNALREGFTPVLARDLTDAMYNPEKPPYVNHDEGTRLVVEYIEKKYCPTVFSPVPEEEPVI